jgi:hypothetical protein
LIVIERALFGFTTKGFGPDRVPIGVPSASRFGPEPGGGCGVLPAGRGAA